MNSNDKTAQQPAVPISEAGQLDDVQLEAGQLEAGQLQDMQALKQNI